MTDATSAIDPICGMTVTISSAKHHARHGAHDYYFCNPKCRERFVAEPARYVNVKTGEIGRAHV